MRDGWIPVFGGFVTAGVGIIFWGKRISLERGDFGRQMAWHRRRAKVRVMTGLAFVVF